MIWFDADRSMDACRVETRAFLKGIDVNRLPAATADAEEEAGVSSPNSTISSISGKRSEREANGEDHELERASSRGISDEEDGDNSRKKLRLSKDQSAILEESFKEHNTLNPVSILPEKNGFFTFISLYPFWGCRFAERWEFFVCLFVLLIYRRSKSWLWLRG